MITGFSVSNFKNLERVPGNGDEQVEFGPLNALIGPNGCGKSSLLQAIDFLRAFFMSSIEVYLKERGWDYRDLPNLRKTSKEIVWSVTAQLDANEQGLGAGRYGYLVHIQPRRYIAIGHEMLLFTPEGAADYPITLLARKGSKSKLLNRQKEVSESFTYSRLPASLMSTLDPDKERDKYPELLYFRSWIERFRQYLIWDPKVLRVPSRGLHDELGLSGEDLAGVLSRMKDKDRNSFDRLVNRLKRLFPTLTDLSIAKTEAGWRSIQLHESNGKDVRFNSQQMSDGVLRLLAITSLLYLDNIPSVITLEEPENGIHPQLIREVVQILREITQRKPPNRCQVFFTTHSPYVLDEFYDHPEQVYCMDRRRPQEGASIVRLSDNKQLNIARETFGRSLGEAWTTGLLGATAGIRHR